ncbi:hypothetical protein UA75_02475 [Actinoalloteichus sp. GBA129-24]|uniref:Uncharacterized protein n=2 Tax=Pseudonocardiaceae TaxID=2070 RepID=A0AAC9L860_9PSEU|nr:hypothetical protein UA74_02470 [Actinoalloteichus fjordicus]APU18534.1 hypothetical protein UA75_02475 [Actinoalloteichus sp. GBA129-24]
MSYQDAGAVTEALQPPEQPGGESIQDMVREAGWQVSAVDWVFTQVTGESIVEKVIMPITGDFNRIAMNGEAWRTVGTAIGALGDTMESNVGTVRESWNGNAAVQHEMFVRTVWKGGLFVEAQIANLVGMAFDKVAEGSRLLCAKALDLLSWLVDKLIDAIAKIWIPAYGWVKAAQLVWDAYQLYTKIMDIIEAVKAIIESAQSIMQSVQSIGSQLAQIKDVRSVDDAIALATGIASDAQSIAEQTNSIRDNASQISSDLNEASGHVRDVAQGTRELPGNLRDGWNETRDNWDEQQQRLRDAPGEAWNAAREGVTDGAQNAWNSTREGAASAWDSVRDGSAAQNAWNSARDGVTNYAQEQYQEQVGQYVDAARDAPGAIRDGAQNAWNSASSAPGNVASAAQSVWSDPSGAASQAWNAGTGAASEWAGAAEHRENLGETGSNARDAWDALRGRS